MSESVAAAIDALFVGDVETPWPEKPPSAIGKQLVTGALRLGYCGFEGDHQADHAVHGGPEKAVHHYAADHYAGWRRDLPAAASSLEPGGFGENVSTFGLTEDDLCIGDVLRMGGATVQISQGRQPCWKLNAHIGDTSMTRRFLSSGRTGWYYRVLDPGDVRAGDTIRLIERPQPQWSLATVIAARFDKTLDREVAAGLAQLPELACSWQDAFNRLSNRR